MNHLRKTFWNRRIPSFMGVFALVLSVASIGWLSSHNLLFGTKAASGATPKNVQISNITDTSFTISYTTDDEVVGQVNYYKDEPKKEGDDSDEEKPKQIAFDDRDKKDAKPLPHRVHYITVPQLEANTKYFYTITSGDEEYQDQEQDFELKTAPTAGDTPKTLPTVTGKVTLYDGAIPTEAIAYVSSEPSQLFSVLLKPDGSYEIPLTGIREKDLSKYSNVAADTKLKMLIINSTLQSNIAILAGQTESPLPQVILPKDYDFSMNAPSPAPTLNDDSNPASYSGTLTPPTFPTSQASSSSSLTIITPKDRQEFQDAQPTFKGTALPNATVTIVINSGTAIQASTTADANGAWQYRPTVPIESGIHTITVSSPDALGTMQTVNRSFTVFTSGSQFIEPSVKAGTPTLSPDQLTGTATPPSPTNPPATPTSAFTATPELSPTSSLSITTDSGNLTLTTSPAVTRGPLAPTGSSSVLVGITAVMISIAVGAILLFAL